MSELSKVRTNIAALKAYKMLSDINARILKAAERISTGKVFNSVGDNPSGYYISKLMQLDISRLRHMQNNIERGVNWLQTQDSKLARIVDMLNEMYNLAAQANSGAITSAERIGLQLGINGFVEEIRDILQSGIGSLMYTGFNLGTLENMSLTGTSAPTMSALSLDNLLLTGSSTSATTRQNIVSAMTDIASAMDTILKQEESIGSWIHRLEFQKEDAQIQEVNQQASLSTIQDADLAEEQIELTKLQILQQTAMMMLTQANTAPSFVLRLFSGG